MLEVPVALEIFVWKNLRLGKLLGAHTVTQETVSKYVVWNSISSFPIWDRILLRRTGMSAACFFTIRSLSVCLQRRTGCSLIATTLMVQWVMYGSVVSRESKRAKPGCLVFDDARKIYDLIPLDHRRLYCSVIFVCGEPDDLLISLQILFHWW